MYIHQQYSEEYEREVYAFRPHILNKDKILRWGLLILGDGEYSAYDVNVSSKRFIPRTPPPPTTPAVNQNWTGAICSLYTHSVCKKGPGRS
jgi:hypothetical protein